VATCPTCRRRYPPEITTCEDDGEALLPDEAFSGADADLPEGLMVGEYRVESKLGEGGFGSVYAAVHPLIGKKAAIKVLHRQYSSNPQMVSRFIAEARAVNQIRHKSIIDIFSFGALDDGRQYYVMELLEGVTLERYQKERGPLPPEDAVPILRQVARAIDAAHAAGIAHRDLKPENVFLTFDDEGTPVPKLLDFGIAKLMGEGAMSGHRTRTGTPMGTPHYMSPEQCRGQNVDHRTDIYSFGIMVHEALTGQLPFEGENVVDLLFKQTSAPAPPMSTVRPELPAALDEPVLRMLEKDPAARPESLGAAVEELARAAASAGLAVRVVPLRGEARRGGDTGSPISGPTSAPGSATATPGSFAEARTVLDASDAGRLPTTGGASVNTLQSDGAEPKPAGARRMVAIVAAVATVLGVALTLWAISPRRAIQGAARAESGAPTLATEAPSAAAPSPPSAVPAVASAAPAVTPEPAAAAEVTLTIDAQPAGTEVYLGGEKLGATPGPLHLKRGDRELTLTLKAPGYQPRELPVVPSKDKELVAPPPAKLATGGKAAGKHTGRGELENPFQ
jgi:serine/threonine-protein kinase